MAPKKKPSIEEKDLQGLKYFKAFQKILNPLHEVGTIRDRAGNRTLFFDHYAGLLLVYFFNPILTSLRGIQQASGLQKVQRLLKCSRASLGSLSEAVQVFDSQMLREIIGELAAQVPLTPDGVNPKALEGLTAVDGTLLPALPKMAWALWQDDKHRAAKMHLVFDVFRWTPANATVTEGNGSEKGQLRLVLERGRLYVTDRGYAEYALFQEILAAGSSFICRIRENAVWRLVEEREVTPEAKAAGVRRDLVVWLGCEKSGAALKQQIRVVEVATGKTDEKGNPEVLLLATDRLDLSADLVALGYRYRWTVELFFRWFKCILGCRHLVSHSWEGVEIQAYVALIASLLISIWTGRKPTKRTFEMICHFFAGWATEEELLAHIAQLEKHNQ
jgi:Transposase DDE domain